MKKIPWKGICIGSIVMTLLVLARCIATVARELYYGRSQWMTPILQDAWFYVGICAAALCCISGVAYLLERRTPRPAEQEE